MTETVVEKQDQEWEPKIIAFLCNWCSYAGADLAGVSRIQYPPNIRIVRVPCSGRLNPFFLIKSLTDGWDGVIVSGCHPGDCHYISGNLVARRRFAVLYDLLEFFVKMLFKPFIDDRPFKTPFFSDLGSRYFLFLCPGIDSLRF